MHFFSFLLNWIKACFSKAKSARHVSSTQIRIAKLDKKRRRSVDAIADRSDLIEELVKRVEGLVEENRDQFEELKSVSESLQREVEGAQEQLHIHESLTIPTLVKSHKLIHERLDADTSIETRRRVIATDGAVE
jgi:FtsZ-binding cell division protein ZapB